MSKTNVFKLISSGYFATLILTLIFFVFLYPFTKSFPYSDDWSYIYYLTNDSIDLTWIFSQHNDHRIPLQKILHLILLKVSGGDFRILIAFNVLTIAITSIFWIMLSRILLKKSSPSEWIVPLLLLSFGFNNVNWGFSFQFISSLFFLSLTNLLWVKFILVKENKFIIMTFVSLILMALCGGNGLITSSIIGFGFSVALLYQVRFKLSWSLLLSISAWAFSVVTIWINYHSSSATDKVSSDILPYIHFGLEMIKSYFGIFSARNSIISYIIGMSLLLIAVRGSFHLFVVNKLVKDIEKQLLMLPLLLSLLQTIIMVVAISKSRAGIQPWFSGLELHYGYLVTPIPIIAWIILLMLPRTSYRSFTIIILCLTMAIAYLKNYTWRIGAAYNEYRKGIVVINDIISTKATSDVSKLHIREFYWIEGIEAESSISNGLILLRKTPFWKLDSDSNKSS